MKARRGRWSRRLSERGSFQGQARLCKREFPTDTHRFHLQRLGSGVRLTFLQVTMDHRRPLLHAKRLTSRNASLQSPLSSPAKRFSPTRFIRRDIAAPSSITFASADKCYSRVQLRSAILNNGSGGRDVITSEPPRPPSQSCPKCTNTSPKTNDTKLPSFSSQANARMKSLPS